MYLPAALAAEFLVGAMALLFCILMVIDLSDLDLL